MCLLQQSRIARWPLFYTTINISIASKAKISRTMISRSENTMVIFGDDH